MTIDTAIQAAKECFANSKRFPEYVIMEWEEAELLAAYSELLAAYSDDIEIDYSACTPQTKFHLEIERIDLLGLEQPKPLTDHQKSYRSRWRKKAIALIDKRAKGKALDRKEARLAEQYVMWRITQEDQKHDFRDPKAVNDAVTEKRSLTSA